MLGEQTIVCQGMGEALTAKEVAQWYDRTFMYLDWLVVDSKRHQHFLKPKDLNTKKSEFYCINI